MKTKNWREVPLPTRMQSLPRDQRGFPVPYVVARDASGQAVFVANDALKMLQVLEDDLCAICGQPLEADSWLVGGPQSAFHERGAYIDPPIHHECGAYALQVCPYLALRGHTSHMPLDRLEKLSQRFSGTALLVDPTMDPNRPPFFVFIKIASYRLTERGHIVPTRPYLKTEYWNAGEQITEQQAGALLVLAQLEGKL